MKNIIKFRFFIFIITISIMLGLWIKNCNIKGKIIMLTNQTEAQMLSCLLCSKNGELVVIDGGWEEDAEYLKKRIKEYGGKVSAWLITHPDSDHIGALLKILKDNSEDIEIENIYYSFADIDWYNKISPDVKGLVYVITEQFSKFPIEKLHPDIKKNDRIIVDNITITVMNNRYNLANDSINNSSIVYRADIGDKRILFLGDLGEEGGKLLLQENSKKELKVNIVQMAHHGQNGVGKDVYEVIEPEICLWPTPEWLWNNNNGGGINSGPWSTLETRKWMKEIGVKKNKYMNGKDTIVNIY